jgi:C4-dicarboxylate-specific signal transduction histidine kinase
VEAAIVIIRDVTDHMLASEALREAQMDLAHVNRVTTMGQLTASIAHEVNQPLAGVIANAEACLRWLNRGTPDLDAARRSVEWIVEDGNRASEVIRPRTKPTLRRGRLTSTTSSQRSSRWCSAS